MRKYEIAVLSKGAFARTVRIYSPSRADRAVIMHDGQNAFSDAKASFGKSWHAIEALKEHGIKNVAVIGIDSTPTRNNDYLPFQSELEDHGMKNVGGKADVYCDYLENTVVPYLTKRFGYKLFGMLGSSAGALVTLFFAAKRIPAFKAYGMFSTPLFVSPAAFDGFFNGALFDDDAYYQIYTGGNEQIGTPDQGQLTRDLFVSDAFKLTTALRNGGAVKLMVDVNNIGVHDETCWQAPAQQFFKTFSKL